jgi:hypothetical protein
MSNASAAATADDKKDDKTPTPPRAPEAGHAETSATDTGAPATTAAEFPKSELLAAMSVFHLGKAAPHELQKSHLTKLAATLNLDPVALIDQFHLFEPSARQNKANSQSSNFEAWANAVVPMQGAASASAPALIATVVRYGCWIDSSSDVERGWP